MTITSSRYLLRPMTVADIPRVSEIERGSFPTMWPQTAYKRELQRNNLAAYLVVCEPIEPGDAEPIDRCSDSLPGAGAVSPEHTSARGLRRLLHRVAEVITDAPPAATADAGERILGFVGLWFMVDEAHIVTIAVEERERRKGLGEMLLIAAIELAQRRSQEVVTLECRVGNLVAQSLYEKYGFRKVGLRKRYYTDNDEDALIMTTFPIQGDEFRDDFERLRTAYGARCGAPRVLPD